VANVVVFNPFPQKKGITMNFAAIDLHKQTISPLKNSFWLRAVEIHQFGVAESRRLRGDVCDSAP